MFQFINYSFAEKEKDGYYKYIGSRLDGNNVGGGYPITIAAVRVPKED